MEDDLEFHTLRVRSLGDKPLAHETLLHLDGLPIHDFVSLDLRIDGKTYVTATLTFECLLDIDIPVEVINRKETPA